MIPDDRLVTDYQTVSTHQTNTNWLHEVLVLLSYLSCIAMLIKQLSAFSLYNPSIYVINCNVTVRRFPSVVEGFVMHSL